MRGVSARLLRALTMAVLAVGATVPAGPPAAVARQEHGDVLVRKNVLELSGGERKAFVKAVRRLKEMPSPYGSGLSYYDQFVQWHLSLYRCSGLDFDLTAGHGGPFFLPWHRAFVLLFERALADASGKPIAVPYWDWASDDSTRSVFRDDFMGGDGDPDQGYAVSTGPFRKGVWSVTFKPEHQPWAASYQPHLVRKFGSGGLDVVGRPELFSRPPVADVTWALSRPAYDAEPWDMRSDPNVSFRNAIEGWWRVDHAGNRYSDPVDHQHCGPDGRAAGMRDGGGLHNRVHTWAGGVMADAGSTTFGTMTMPTSPSDPLFFLHHANIDRLWEKWQRAHPHATFEPRELTTLVMEPFRSTGAGSFSPTSVESTRLLGYRYSDFTDSDDEAGLPMVAMAAASVAPPSTSRGDRVLDFTCVILA